MTSKARLLLKDLLDRLDADVATERPQFRSVVSDDTREALRSLLEDVNILPRRSSTEPVERTAEKGATDTQRSAVELNTHALHLESSPAPHWTLCLDFGTAKSKAFAANNEDEEQPDLEPLPIGKTDKDLDGSVHEISSSVWIDDDGLLFMGSEAVKRGTDYGDLSATTRRRLDSLKQEISQVLPEDGSGQLGRKLPREIDPTSTLTYMDVITFYLAYLTDLAITELEPLAQTRYVRRRFTLPWWTKEQRRWAGGLLTKCLVRAQLLADTFHGRWREGIHVKQAKQTLRDAVAHDEQLMWMLASESNEGVLEALAAASARLWTDRYARDVMLVVDVGAGTTDLSLFWVVQSHGTFHRAWPIEPCGVAIRQAGDTLDSLLVDGLLRKANLGADSALKKRVSDNLYRQSVRRLKETLFSTGEITERLVNDQIVRMKQDEFVNSEGVKRFETRIVDEIQKLLEGVHESWGPAVPDHGIMLVLTGGGCNLPMIRSLEDKRWTLGTRRVKSRRARYVPGDVEERFSAEFIREYPKLAVAMGGALKMRLDEKKAMTEWPGRAQSPGDLEKF